MRTIVLMLLAAGLPGVAAAEVARPRGGYEKLDVIGEDRSPSAAPNGVPTIFFLNKNGGTYRPGNENAGSNYSSIIDSVSSIPAWNVSASGWNQVKACMTSMFARWNVTITDVDPGATPHYELVIAGSPGDIGMEDGVGGVSPFSSNCGVIPNTITYTFAEVYGTQYRDICETAAQEVAHSFGLDHEYLCTDPMTYLYDCGDKSFQNTAAPCGEYSARQCACGGSTQNSVTMLDARLGLAGATVPPTVQITSPDHNDTVAPGFTVAATATDDGTVARAELWIDGTQQGSDSSSPYSFTAPANLSDGDHDVEVRAYDAGGAMGSDTIDVTVGTGGGGGPDAGVDGTDPDAGAGGGAGGDDDGTLGDDYIVGGCAAGGGSTGALLGLLALGLLRRRQRLPA